MERISIRAFSREVRVSDTAIRKAIEAGRITSKSLTTNAKNGRPELFKLQALKEWQAAGGGLVKDFVNPKDNKTPTGSVTPQQETDPNLVTTAESKRKSALYDSQMKALDLAERRGVLVNKSKVFEELFSFGNQIKSSLLVIPDKYLDLILSAPTRVEANNILTNALHETLKTLSNANNIKLTK